MNTLFISYDGMTDPLGQSQVIPYLIGLSEKGFKISLISCEKKDRFKIHKNTIQNLLTKNNISWHPISYSTLPSILSKQSNLYRLKRKTNSLAKKENFKVVHCRSYMAALIGLQLKKKFGIKLIFDMRGFWADERIDGKIWSLTNPIQKKLYTFFKKKEIEFLKNADYTISLTQNAKDEISSWKEFKHQPIPIEVIPCCADLDLFSTKNIDPINQNHFKKQLNISETDFVISYLGSIGTWYMLDEMLDFFKQLLIAKPNSKFLIITPDDKQHIIYKANQKNIPTDKISIVAAQRKDVPTYLSLSQISIYFIKPLYSKKASSPTKTAEIMGMGIPIITNTGIGDSDKIINDSKAGLIINEFNKNEYLKVINQIDILLKSDRNTIVQSACEYFSLEKGVELYFNVYKNLKL